MVVLKQKEATIWTSQNLSFKVKKVFDKLLYSVRVFFFSFVSLFAFLLVHFAQDPGQWWILGEANEAVASILGGPPRK